MAEVKLKSFFIINPSLSKSEGEEEKKILYYYPQNIEKDVQLKNTGLCEALIKFTASFQPDRPCELFCTEKTKQFFYEPEPGYWMAMTISAENDENVSSSDLIHENIGHAVLEFSYKTFFVFSGSFEMNMSENDPSRLKNKLQGFFETYLAGLSFGKSNIMDVFQGIQYLPLGREPFLHVQSFINQVETLFAPVRYSVFLYNDYLVWSGIDPSNMQIVYQYLVRTLLPSYPDMELQGGSVSGMSPVSAVRFGNFVTCPAELKNHFASSTEVPKVFLHCSKGIKCFHLIVYRALSATFCLFLPESTQLSLNLFKNLENHIGPRLTSLVSEITEHCVRSSSQTSTETTSKFIYFNKLNLAIKSSVLESRKGGAPTFPPDIMRLIANIHEQPSLSCDNGEIALETETGSWVVVKYSNDREFYIVVQKKLKLPDVGTEVQKICNTQLKGIFFLT